MIHKSEKVQTTQWSKENGQRDKQRCTKHYTENQRTSLKTEVVFHDIPCGHADYYITKVVLRANKNISAFLSLQEMHCNCLFVIFSMI